MRLFIATPIIIPTYQIIKDKLSKYITAKWVEGYNLHLTHYFIGDANAEDYKIKLDIPNEDIIIKNLSMFDKKVLFFNAYSKNINAINKQFNKNSFKPHITLCRIKSINDEKFFDEIKKIDFSYKVKFEVYLYQSILTPKGPIYKKIYKY
jgi:2'-5' RNA ligase